MYVQSYIKITNGSVYFPNMQSFRFKPSLSPFKPHVRQKPNPASHHCWRKPTLTQQMSTRSTSNLSVLLKLLEHLVLTTQLSSPKLLPRLQNAYRAHHSTETAVLKVLADILCAAGSSNLALLTLLELSAFFDTVDHVMLLHRLHVSYGISSTVHTWSASYLWGHWQYVRSGSTTSTPTAVLFVAAVRISNGSPLVYYDHYTKLQIVAMIFGVPQGSALCPFILCCILLTCSGQ